MSAAVPVSQLSLPQLDTIKSQLEEVSKNKKNISQFLGSIF